MTRTKKTCTIVAALLGMLMLTANSAIAAPPHWKHKHGHYTPRKVRWSRVIGRTVRSIPRRRYVASHYVTEYRTVMVSPGHYETQTQQVLVQPGHHETVVTVPAVTKAVTQADGSTQVVIVQPAQTTRVWIPDRFETRETQVWIPAQYETRAYQRLVSY